MNVQKFTTWICKNWDIHCQREYSRKDNLKNHHITFPLIALELGNLKTWFLFWDLGDFVCALSGTSILVTSKMHVTWPPKQHVVKTSQNLYGFLTMIFCKKVFLKIFLLTRKHRCWSLTFNKVVSWKSATFSKRDSNTGVFL